MQLFVVMPWSLPDVKLWLLLQIAIFGIAGWALAATRDQLDPAKSYQTADITFSGNHRFSNSALTAVMQTHTQPFYQFWKARPPFDPDTFDADMGRLKRLYQKDGYYRATIKYQLDVRGKLITAHIVIDEGPRVNVASVILKANGAVQPVVLNPQFKLPLATGDPFDERAYQLGEQKLLGLYQRHGYPFAHASRGAEVYVGPGRAYIWYAVTPENRANFGSTTIEGTRKVNQRLVTRELTYKAGEQFDAGKVAASRQKILNLNLFSSVDFVPQENPDDRTIVPIVVKVREKPPRQVNLMIGYNTESLFNASIQWNHYNFLGGGRQLLLDATYSDITSYLDAKLIQPYLLSRNTRGILEVMQEQETYQTYTLNASRFQPRIDYLITPQLIATFGWRLEYLKFDTLNPLTIAAEGGVRRDGILSGPAGSAIYNTTDDPLDPHHGIIMTFQGNIANHLFGSDYRYWRTLGELRHYVPVGWKTIFASRVELGLADTFGPTRDIPLSERFYSGGEGSVRGYGLRRIGPLSPANEPLGGLSLFEGSVELRRPLFWRLAGATFFDCGQVSVHPYRIPVGNLQCGYGPAVSMATPVGPVRLDLGIPTKRPRGDASWQVYFSIGQFY